MKKMILPILLLTCVSGAIAQQKDEAEQKNIVKINLFALALKNISIQYERAVGKKISIAGLIRLMPKGSIPFKSAIKNAVDDPDTEKQVENTRVGNFAFTPEVRYYVGRKGALHGFYIAGFTTIANYTAELPYQYTDAGTTKTIPMSGNVTTFTGGIMFGSQWKLGKRVNLDLWIIGPNYGTSNGKLSGQKALTPSEQSSLRSEFDDLDIPFTKTSYDVNANGATLFIKGPWAGIRSGLCVGFAF